MLGGVRGKTRLDTTKELQVEEEGICPQGIGIVVDCLR
jgi:hypothetical protein